MLRQILTWLQIHMDETAALYLLVDDWQNASTWSQRFAVIQRGLAIVAEIAADFPAILFRPNTFGFAAENDATIETEFGPSFAAIGITGTRWQAFTKFLKEFIPAILPYLPLIFAEKEKFAASRK